MRRNKLRVYIHFVWATWDRVPMVLPEIERELHRYISAVCKDDGCDVLAVGGMGDHVHVLVSLPATISMAELMKHVKGGSSHFASVELGQGEAFKWQGHYGAFSVSPRDRERVVEYIRNQKQHHADGTVWPETEEPTEEYVIADAT